MSPTHFRGSDVCFRLGGRWSLLDKCRESKRRVDLASGSQLLRLAPELEQRLLSSGLQVRCSQCRRVGSGSPASGRAKYYRTLLTRIKPRLSGETYVTEMTWRVCGCFQVQEEHFEAAVFCEISYARVTGTQETSVCV